MLQACSRLRWHLLPGLSGKDNSALSQGVLPLPTRIDTDDWLHEYTTNISHSIASNALHINIILHVFFNTCTNRQVILYKSVPYVPFVDNVFHQLHKVT